MTRINKLLPASFKGIPFYVKNEILSEGGRRIILHDYPNSSQRFVEDQGELPPKFSVTAFVTGVDFIDRAEQLERALREEGKGRLSMPTFGVKKLFALPYKKDASQTSVGEIKFDLEFVEGRSISGPSKSTKTPQTVYAQGDKARGSILDVLKQIWIEPRNTTNVIAAQFDLEQYADTVRVITTVANNSGDINGAIDLIMFNSPSLIRTAEDLASTFIGNSTDSTGGLFQLVSVGLEKGKAISELIDLTKFGSLLSLSLSDIKNSYVPENERESSSTIPLWNETTAERATRNQNRLSLINAGRVASLVCAYEQIADADYKTDSEIEETIFNIETEHQRLMRDDTENRTLIQSYPEVRNAVEDIRISALEVLGQKGQSAFSLTTINNKTPVSSFVQAYNLYAEDLKTSDELITRGIEIRNLNPTLPSDKLIGEITVLQS